MNNELLLAVVLLAGENLEILAEILNLTLQQLDCKMRELGDEFSQNEIIIIQQHFNLNERQVQLIFFAN